ncbi:MAG: hypothetical protein SNJ75_05910 [Gemmataceae bacterium]
MDRREFAALAALGLLGPRLVPQADAEPAPPADDEKLPALPEALLAQLLARCGDHLSPADRKALRARLAGSRLGTLAGSLKLDWRDEPAFVYSPDVQE